MKIKLKPFFGAALSSVAILASLASASAQASDPIVFQAPVVVENVSQKGKPSYTTEWWVASMNSDGTGAVPLARGYSPEWSPDRQYIAFGGPDGLSVMEASGVANGGRAFAVASDIQSTGWDWSPDGTRLCYSPYSSQGLWVVEVNPVTEEVGPAVQVSTGWCGYPSWSPDGTRIAYTFLPAGVPWGNQYIVVLDLQTGTQSAFDMVSSAHPAWSPDGSQIAFDAYVIETITKGKKTTTNGYVELFIANADGSGAVQVTNYKGTTGLASWSPDGRSLAVTREINGTRSLYRVDLSTGAATFLHDGQGPDWNP